jgi:hypothetical protein
MRTSIIDDTKDLIRIKEARKLKLKHLTDDRVARIWQQLIIIHSILVEDFHSNTEGGRIDYNTTYEAKCD